MASNNPTGPFSRGYKTSPRVYTANSTRKTPAASTRKYDTLLAKSDKLLRMSNKDITYMGVVYTPEERITRALRQFDFLLTPAEIEIFLSLTQQYESRELYSVGTGLLVTRLIQQSYHHGGHTQFALDLRALKPLDRLCYDLTVKDDFEIRIQGNVGSDFGHLSRGGTYYVDELMENSLVATSGGSYYITKANWEVGAAARNARFYIKEATSEVGARSNNCDFFILHCNRLEHHGTGSSTPAQSRFFIAEARQIVGSYLSTYVVDELSDVSSFRMGKLYFKNMGKYYVKSSSSDTKVLNQGRWEKMWNILLPIFADIEDFCHGGYRQIKSTTAMSAVDLMRRLE